MGEKTERPPAIFVRLQDANGKMLCLLPMGIALCDEGHGVCGVRQFHGGANVGSWSVRGQCSEIADQFEARAETMRTQMMFEAAGVMDMEGVIQRRVEKAVSDAAPGMRAAFEKLLRQAAGETNNEPVKKPAKSKKG